MSQNLTNSVDQAIPGPYQDTAPIKYPLFVSYVAFGAPAVLANLFVLLVVFSDKKLRIKSAFIVGLAGGNLCNGLHAFGYGLYRLPLLLAGSLDQPASSWWCMASMMPTFCLLGFSLPATLQFASGLERMVAITAFKWYRINWSPRKNWYMVGATYVVSICVWVLPSWYRIFSDHTIKVTRECSSAVTLSSSLSRNMSTFVMVIGSTAVICLLTAVVVGYRNHRHMLLKHSSGESTTESSQYKTQLRVSRMMLVVAICELAMVVLPSTLLTLSLYYPTVISPMVTMYALDMYCINSISNMFIYHGMNAAFRKAAAQKFGWIPRLCICKDDANAVHASTQGSGSQIPVGSLAIVG